MPFSSYLLSDYADFDKIMNEMSESIFLTREELMEYLKIKRSTLQKLMNKGDLPYFKLGRRILFKKEEIDRWIESKRVK